jgi:hypothetical protein
VRATGTKRQGVPEINWIYYPASRRAPRLATDVVTVFEKCSVDITSPKHDLKSNEVLHIVAPHLKGLGFRVETGKKAENKVTVPVLFGRNGKLRKHFCADAFNESEGFVLEIEAGRALSNNQFLKDLFQACLMTDVTILCIAVRNLYGNQKDFEYISTFFDTLYASNRVQLPLQGILLIGY